MPYKDPEHKRQWEQKHRQERSQRHRAQRTELSSTISPELVPPVEPSKKEEEHSGWGVFLLSAGIVVSLTILLTAFRVGTTRSVIPRQN
jgi:hypothetical protein